MGLPLQPHQEILRIVQVVWCCANLLFFREIESPALDKTSQHTVHLILFASLLTLVELTSHLSYQ